MADAAAARREARRKKILENSQNRLQLISGKPGNEEPDRSSPRPFLSEDNCEHFLTQETPYTSSPLELNNVNNGTVLPEPELVHLLTSQYESGDTDVNPILHPLPSTTRSPPEKPLPPPLWHKLVSNRYDIVLLSLLFQVIHSLVPSAFENSYFFLPLATYVITKYVYFPSNQKSNFANVLMLLQGMSPTRVQRLIKVTQVLSVFSQDVCIFLFTLICVQSVLGFFTNNVTT